MPPTKAFLYLATRLLLCCSILYDQSLFAQQPAANLSGTSQTLNSHPRNPAAIDSLLSLNASWRLNRKFNARQTLSNKTFLNKDIPLDRFAERGLKVNSADRRSINPAERPAAVCYTISGRNFLNHDSLLLYTNEPTLLADGNVIMSGEFVDAATNPMELGGFCLKSDIQGNIIWAKLYDSTAEESFDYVNYFRTIELKDGTILMAGRTTNNVSKNDDFILTRLDNNGNQIWTKTYESRFWQGFNGSGDFFNLREMEEDMITGEIYFVGSLWGGISTITKVDPADGHVIWSNGYDSWGSDQPFGIVIEPGQLLLFQLEYGHYDEYIGVRKISKVNGDTLSGKHLVRVGTWDDPHMFNTFSVVKLNNGHYRMSGPTTLYYEFPTYTGTIDLYHAMVVELDNNFDFVNAFVFKNRFESNGYNTKISLYPDGTGVFTMFDYNSPYTGEAHISIFKDDLIYHQRKRIHINEGMPYEPFTLQLPGGGMLNIKLMGDSTALAIDGSKIDYYQMHTSDTASLCLGVKDSATSIMLLNYEPIIRGMDSLTKNVFRESRVKRYDSWNFRTTQVPSCVVISHCDSLDIKVSASTICPGNNVIVTIGKNKECGGLVPLVYDTSFVDHVTKLTDSTYSFHFEKPGAGYIYGSLMGCVLHSDSVYIQVLPARYSLDLGADTVICPGNQIKLNAREGFLSYLWQDGSIDSTYNVLKAGTYYVTAINGCGSAYKDTIEVRDHPTIPISIGPDRNKCNADTLRLQANAGFMNYKWTPDYNISTVSGQSVIINPQVDTLYMVAAELKPGCFAYDTVRIKVTHSPKINLGADTSICRKETLALDGGAGFSTYLWNTGNTDRNVYVDQPGVYFVKATTSNGCSSFDTLALLSLYDLPQPNLGPDSLVCIGQPRILNGGNQYTSYLWNTGSVNNSIVVNQTGQFWLTVTDVNGCKGSDTTFVPALKSPPGGFLGRDTSICSYGIVQLEPSMHFGLQLWSNGATSSGITIHQPGIYWLEVTDDNGCKGRDTIIIGQKDCMEGLFVPSAFTPNNDGLNDLFTPMAFGDIRTFRFRVYNRWGEVVFETATPGTGWNGNYNGKKQDSNVFVWSCTYQLNGQKVEQRSGKVVLIR